MAGRRSARPAQGLSAVRPGRHRQDVPGRVPRRRGRRAGGEAEELPRPLGRIQRGQSGEDLPPGARARPLHRVHRRGRPDARPARFGRRRQRPLGAHLFDDRAGDGRLRQPRPRGVDPGLVAPRPDRGRSQAPGPHRREGADPAHHHRGGERRAARRARPPLRARRSTPADLAALEPRLPVLLTPGAAEALVVKAYRHARTRERRGRRRRSRPASRATRTRCRPTCSSCRCGWPCARRPTSPSCRRLAPSRRGAEARA